MRLLVTVQILLIVSLVVLLIINPELGVVASIYTLIGSVIGAVSNRD